MLPDPGRPSRSLPKCCNTAPIIHAGFGVKTGDPTYQGSQIRLEIFHHGYYPVKLKEGMLICQLILEEVHGTPVKGYGQLLLI